MMKLEKNPNQLNPIYYEKVHTKQIAIFVWWYDLPQYIFQLFKSKHPRRQLVDDLLYFIEPSLDRFCTGKH